MIRNDDDSLVSERESASHKPMQRLPWRCSKCRGSWMDISSAPQPGQQARRGKLFFRTQSSIVEVHFRLRNLRITASDSKWVWKPVIASRISTVESAKAPQRISIQCKKNAFWIGEKCTKYFFKYTEATEVHLQRCSLLCLLFSHEVGSSVRCRLRVRSKPNNG